MIERKIIIGLITNTEYIKAIRKELDTSLFASDIPRYIADWCLDYYEEYKQAPNQQIEDIYFQKIQEGLPKDIGEEIEEDILPELSEEYDAEGLNVDYLIKETKKYIDSRKLVQLGEELSYLMDGKKGNLETRLKDAENRIKRHKTIKEEKPNHIEVSDLTNIKIFEEAFEETSVYVATFAKALGKFLNHHLIAGALIGIQAPEKRGKTFLLLEFAMNALRNNKSVALFQAGDMNRNEQLKRIGVYLCKRSDKEIYCKEHYETVKDCVRNQMDECSNVLRECSFGVFVDKDEKEIKDLTYDELVEAYEENEDYEPCYNCDAYYEKKLGVPWLKKIPKEEPIEIYEVLEAVKRFFSKYKGRFKLATYANGTLSTDIIENDLEDWYEEDGFVADEILVDYADILLPTIKSDFRHQQNQIWKDLRRLSQTERHGVLPLVIAPTQTDADAYDKDIQTQSNYSEDKRKYGHVTLMLGLNQGNKGKDKKCGIMNINKLIAREGDFIVSETVSVIQNLRKGRPCLGSFFGK